MEGFETKELPSQIYADLCGKCLTTNFPEK